MGKRGATQIVSGAKRGKVDPISHKCQEVNQALKSIAGLDDGVKEMMCEMLPLSLGTCQAERHQYQARVVEMFNLMLGKQETRLRELLQECEEKVHDLLKEKETCEEAVAKADAAFTEKEALVFEKKQELAHAAMAFRASRTAFAEAEAKQTSCDHDFIAAKNRKEQLEDAFEGTFRTLKDGSTGTLETSQQATEFIGRIAAICPLDESLATALPAALSMAPSARGTFDNMAVHEVETSIQRHIEALSSKIEEGAEGKAAREEAVKAAVQGHEAAKMQQEDAAEAYEAADAERRICMDCVQTAKKTLAALGPRQRRDDKALSHARNDLDAFQQGALASFEDLRTRAADVVVEGHSSIGDENV